MGRKRQVGECQVGCSLRNDGQNSSHTVLLLSAHDRNPSASQETPLLAQDQPFIQSLFLTQCSFQKASPLPMDMPVKGSWLTLHFK